MLKCLTNFSGFKMSTLLIIERFGIMITVWGTQEETHTFTIIASLNYLFSITRKDNRHNITTHRAHAQLTVPNYITDHITYIYTSALSLLALTKLIPLNLTVSENGASILWIQTFRLEIHKIPRVFRKTEIHLNTL